MGLRWGKNETTEVMESVVVLIMVVAFWKVREIDMEYRIAKYDLHYLAARQ